VRDADADCDVFRDGGFWYSYSNGYWYRARSYRGPFAFVDVRMVPRRIFAVPAERWRHYPGNLAAVDRHRFYERDRGSWRNWDDDHYRGGGRGGRSDQSDHGDRH